MVSDRPIRFGEASTDSRSMDYDLGMSEMGLGGDGSSSGGEVIFAAQLRIVNGQVTIESCGSGPYKIVQIRTWK